MANAYSILHNYQQELYTPNLELINTALQFKQQTLNANREKLQSMYDQFSFLDVAKGEDQEYLEERLQATKSIMDKYSSLDLSSNNLTNQLVSTMSDVVDDNVKNAVISTRIYRAEQAAWQKLRDENPEKYSETNHAFANQAANQWLLDGQTGSKYNGGGGVIEFSDVQGKLAEQIPEIAKSLNAEFVELADGTGYFRDVKSGERVRRDQLEQSLEGILNEKDRKQLYINAWARYDGMSDQQLEASYTNHFSQQINKTRNEIASLERAIQATKDPDQLAERMSLLNFYQNKLASYENSTYENVVTNYGREGAYNTLYDNQFKENYLGPYSYSDRVTEIKTYETDVEQRNYEHTLRNFQLDQEKFGLEKQKFALQVEEFEAEQRGAAGAAGTTGPLVGKPKALTYKEMASVLEQQHQLDMEAINNVGSLFGLDISDQAGFRDLAEVFRKGYVEKGFIEFRGKKVELTKDVKKALLTYENRIINKSPYEKEAMEVFRSTSEQSLTNLRKIAQGDNPHWDFVTGTPKFRVGFKLDKETGTMKVIDIPENIHPYAYLLRKENLSEDEKYTLGVYHKWHMLMDPELNDDQKRLIFDDLQTNVFSKLSNEDFNKMPYDMHAYNRMSTRRDMQGYKKILPVSVGSAYQSMKEDGFIEEYTDFITFRGGGTGDIGTLRIAAQTYSGYEGIVTDIIEAYKNYEAALDEDKPKFREKINSLKNILDTDRKLMFTNDSPRYKDYYLSDIDKGDAEYYDKYGNLVSLDKGIDDILTDGLDLYAEVLERGYKEQQMEASLYPQIFGPKIPGYENLLNLIGLPDNHNIPITLSRGWDEETKKPTSEVKWSTKIKGEEGQFVTINQDTKGIEIGDVSVGLDFNRLDVEVLRNNNIIDFETPTRIQYDAAFGENAPTLRLGNNVYSDNMQDRNLDMFGGQLYMNWLNRDPVSNKPYPQMVLDEAETWGGAEFRQSINDQISAFEQGKYEFKMEAIDGYWKTAIYDETGTRLGSFHIDGERKVTQYTDDEVIQIHDRSALHVDQAMYQYLKKQIDAARIEYLRKTETSVRQTALGQ